MSHPKKRLSSLDCRLPPGLPVVLRHAANTAYLEGEDRELSVGGHSKWWWRLGALWRGFFLLFAAVWLTFLVYNGTWNSPLAAETPATSLEVVDGGGNRMLAYSYQVEGETYQRTESPGSTWKSSWESGDPDETIRYLTFWPSRAHLDFRVERWSWGGAISITLFVFALAYAGHLTMKTQRHLERIAEGCTHIVPGSVVQVIPSQNFRYVIYSATSPTTGQEIREKVMVGEGEAVKTSLVVGAPVAVLYRDDESHTLL